MGDRKLAGTLRHGNEDVPVQAIGIQHAFSESATVLVAGAEIKMKKVS